MRSCLDGGPASTVTTATHEPKIRSGAGVTSGGGNNNNNSTANTFAHKMRNNEVVMKALGSAATATTTTSLAAAAYSQVNHRGSSGNHGDRGGDGNQGDEPYAKSASKTTSNATTQMVHLSKQGQAGLVSKLQQQQQQQQRCGGSKKETPNEATPVTNSSHASMHSHPTKTTAVVLPQPHVQSEETKDEFLSKTRLHSQSYHREQQQLTSKPSIAVETHHHHHSSGNGSDARTADDEALRDSTAAFVTAEILSEYPMDLSDSRIRQTVDRVLQAKTSAADVIGGGGKGNRASQHHHQKQQNPTALSMEEAKVLMSIERLNERLAALQQNLKSKPALGSATAGNR